MKTFVLASAAAATLVFASDPAMAYWGGQMMGPPPVPAPPSGFPGPMAPPWLATDSRAQEQSQTADREKAGPERNAVQAMKAELKATRKALKNIRKSREQLVARCQARRVTHKAPRPVVAGSGGHKAPREAQRLSNELAAARVELVEASQRIDSLVQERDRLRAELKNGMGDRTSVRNAFEQVRKRAVELETALRESRGFVGAEIERSLLKTELDRLIAALALADAVLADPGDGSPGRQITGGASLEVGGLPVQAVKPALTEAASFEPAL